MSELTYTVIRLGLLALLWVFVFSLAVVLRRDIYGTRISARTARKRAAQPVPAAARAEPRSTTQAQPEPARQPRRRGTPHTLVVTEGTLAGTSLPLGRNGVLIGRGPECTLVIDDEYASSRHARIYPGASGWVVEDQGSRNGTMVGGTKITGPVPAVPGTVVRIGHTSLELRD